MSCLQSNFYAAKRSRALTAGCSGLGFTINCFYFFVIVDSLQICFVLPPAQLDGASAFNRSDTVRTYAFQISTSLHNIPRITLASIMLTSTWMRCHNIRCSAAALRYKRCQPTVHSIFVMTDVVMPLSWPQASS